MDTLVKDNLTSIQQLLIKYKVEHAYLFGSAAKDMLRKDSDIDILVRFSNQLDVVEYGTYYFELMYALQDLLKREVDLVAEETVTNPYLLQSINVSKVVLL